MKGVAHALDEIIHSFLNAGIIFRPLLAEHRGVQIRALLTGALGLYDAGAESHRILHAKAVLEHLPEETRRALKAFRAVPNGIGLKG